jgi:hypothetical protein
VLASQTREQREYQLVGMMLVSPATLRAVYTIVMNRHPSPDMTDRDVIQAVLALEYPRQTALPNKPR